MTHVAIGTTSRWTNVRVIQRCRGPVEIPEQSPVRLRQLLHIKGVLAVGTGQFINRDSANKSSTPTHRGDNLCRCRRGVHIRGDSRMKIAEAKVDARTIRVFRKIVTTEGVAILHGEIRSFMSVVHEPQLRDRSARRVTVPRIIRAIPNRVPKESEAINRAAFKTSYTTRTCSD